MKHKNSIIQANSLGEAWLKSLAIVLNQGDYTNDGPDKLLEICNLYIRISRICEDDLIIRNYADKSRLELMKLKYRSCGIVYNYKISYGKLLYDNLGVNQIEWVIDRIKNKPETKSATIGFHHPGSNELSCLSSLDFKLRKGFLSMTAIYRSQNVYGSQPGNVLALSKVQEYVAKQVEAEVGEFNLVLLSAHIYECDIEKVKRLLQCFPKIYSRSMTLNKLSNTLKAE